MKTLHIDLETFSSVDIKSAGAHRYVDSDDFEILWFSYAIDDSPVVKISLATGDTVPDRLISTLHDPQYVKMAYNAEFEFLCLSKYYGRMIPSQWRCTRLHALYCGYPASLDAVCKALGMSEDKKKLKTGTKLIQYFSKPQKNGTRNSPHDARELWKLYGDYNAQDVEAEREIERLLSSQPVPDFIQKQFETNIIINLRGVKIDRELADGAIDIGVRASNALFEEAQALTGLDNPKSTAQVKKWLSANGVEVDGLGKDAVKVMLSSELDDSVRSVLENRLEISKSSTKKYDKMLECICSDGRLHGMLSFYGANRSGRWSGQLVQPQNLPRTYVDLNLLPLTRNLIKHRNYEAIETVIGPVLDTLSQLIRTVFIPSDGNTLIDCDFSAIEARVISWIAGETWRVKAFENGEDIYCSTASRMFKVPVVKHGENGHLRQQGKVAELACGYQGGVGAMRRMDVGHALDSLPDSEIKKLVDQWRTANPKIVKLWSDCQDAAVTVIERGGSVSVADGKLMFSREYNPECCTSYMTVRLPSGRKLFYVDPVIGANRFGGISIMYMGTNQETKRWGRIESYGGKIVENIIQAIARDCLAESIEKLESRGFPIVFHIHDEVVIDMDTNGKDAEKLNEVVQIMSEVPHWARGLPLTGDGWTGQFFRKD